MIPEMRLQAAISGRKVGDRMTPLRWLRFLFGDVTGNRFSVEMPYSNRIIVPDISKYASINLVEICAVAVRISVEICTATIIA